VRMLRSACSRRVCVRACACVRVREASSRGSRCGPLVKGLPSVRTSRCNLLSTRIYILCVAAKQDEADCAPRRACVAGVRGWRASACGVGGGGGGAGDREPHDLHGTHTIERCLGPGPPGIRRQRNRGEQLAASAKSAGKSCRCLSVQTAALPGVHVI
jgi:hypothetical protein